MRQRGFTLIELLVALGVAAMLGLFIFASYSAISVGGLRASDESAEQNSARVGITLLADDLSRAGFMMNGPSGQNRCSRLLVYNGNTNANTMLSMWPVSAVQQTTSGQVPGTTTSFGYANPGGAATDAVSVFYAAGFGIGNSTIPGGVNVVKANNGTLNNASLFVADTSSFQAGDVDIVVLPSRNLCIRFQVSNVGGGNNIVHNSGAGSANINPPNGFNGVSSLANPPVSPAITATDLQQAFVQNFGQIQGASGPLQVTYSIRPDRQNSAMPDLWRTVVNSLGQTVSDVPVVQNVVLLHALFAPIQGNGQIGSFVPWSTIVSNNQQGQVGAVRFALLVRKPNTGNRTNNPASIAVLDETFTPPGPQFQYQLYTQTVYLRNVAWNAS
ncbi:PilW family protein [Thiomonas sp.]|jgi:prepilin-type N-terminal cleavage/methylation domain-containing protein|uniref:PilW family protein n=1 Tax=Thiomonas sp. TaxID=2047785 RepID=UPI0026206FF1|nr:PilW family protein [Thiomonas sp.]